jgi:hypothetical protein
MPAVHSLPKVSRYHAINFTCYYRVSYLDNDLARLNLEREPVTPQSHSGIAS